MDAVPLPESFLRAVAPRHWIFIHKQEYYSTTAKKLPCNSVQRVQTPLFSAESSCAMHRCEVVLCTCASRKRATTRQCLSNVRSRQYPVKGESLHQVQQQTTIRQLRFFQAHSSLQPQQFWDIPFLWNSKNVSTLLFSMALGAWTND